MIKVCIKKQEHKVNSICIKGHSGYANAGSDIVCASVSTLVITSVNMMLRLDFDSVQYEVQDGFIDVEIRKHSKYIDTVIENMLDLLGELEKNYKKYIKIIK